MNRILQFLTVHECKCCVAKRQHEKLKAHCDAIEADALGTIRFGLPSVKRLAGERDDFEDEEGAAERGDVPTLRFFIDIESDPAPIDCDLREYAARELNRIGEELLAAAEALEGGVV